MVLATVFCSIFCSEFSTENSTAKAGCLEVDGLGEHRYVFCSGSMVLASIATVRGEPEGPANVVAFPVKVIPVAIS